jgi:2'-5' RNA ligase
MRLFIGIPLADTAVGELSALLSRLRGGSPGTGPGASGLRWTEPDSWHITLQFLGNSTPEQLQCLTARLGEVQCSRVPLQIGELGCFDRTGVFFADAVVSPALATLRQRVVSATSACGFNAETRPFHPHITLARTKGHGRGAELLALKPSIHAQPHFARFAAKEFLLYESHLGAERANYEIRGRFPLLG